MKRPMPKGNGKGKAKDQCFAEPSKQKTMKRVETCQKCRMLEKQKYWTDFDPTRHQFVKFMFAGDFENVVVIPRKFAKNFKGKLSNTAHVRGPSGHIWAVKFTKTTHMWLLQKGWEVFVKDHGLGLADFLVFRYEGDSTFRVTMFDRTGCEKEDSYFIKEHTSSCSQKCSATPNTDSTASSENVISSDDSDDESASRGNVMSSDDSDSEDEYACRENMMSLHDSEDESASEENADDSEDENLQKKIHHKRAGGNKSSKDITDAESSAEESGEKRNYSVIRKSNRRPVTKEEKRRALSLAKKHSSSRQSFKMVMKPTNVYKFFFMNMSKRWARKHIPSPTPDNLEIQLRVPPSEKTWSCRLKNKWKFGIGRGWCQFVKDNKLEEDDVCIFELRKGGKARKEAITFDVIIFRVCG